MKQISLFLALLMVLAVVVPAAASPFGEDVVPLEREELEMIDGEYNHILVGAAAGALFGVSSYLLTTPSSDWNWMDAARSALAGAVSGGGGAALK